MIEAEQRWLERWLDADYFGVVQRTYQRQSASTNMILIVGLGNPGKKYQKTRHNLGFRVVDEIAANFQFSPALSQKGGVQSIFNVKISKGEIANKKIILAKPQTFMNLSGKAVKKLISNIQNLTSKLWIIHDDIDIPLGEIRIVKNRSSAGHKGVESIIRELKTKDFVRFRVGVKPKTSNLKPETLDRFVLQKFTREEEKILKKIIKKTIEIINFSLKSGIEKTMQKFNK